MFIEPSDEIKNKILEDFRNFIWVYTAGFRPARSEDKDDHNGHLVLAMRADFVEKLVESSGGDAADIQRLIRSSLALFNACLGRAIELSLTGDPIRKESLRELIIGLTEIHRLIYAHESDYRSALLVERGDQSLPEFLLYSISSLRSLLTAYIDRIIEEGEIPPSGFVMELIAECNPEELEDLTAGIDLLGEMAARLLPDPSLSEEDLYRMLLEKLPKLLTPES